ncbi:LacI family DNA-binding transcriptional regulator [Frankia sp. CNm7]|uniref:LacI family DNA-binding transcriptional regulator n=1 Tax=Frankia nepalensis TaxID=1836974 RepID=A0A937REN1_9ACTN|nr:LacI family DNA-binding transcriptional regulator [Frankia nepalensis]MBL7496355.1 LacI family DNA-binding transcriptional regulator [Frankia nepalensis]MBL7508448.1 LacI family DNA-binding transcriptional regulator [Frankia nepalensis]MBL7520266.1 LacI family DNA-binding transcriptional regulator [Frankia nepalensis]MBL7627580.1 LacI family DNA-binding transcriptional regulator [Frankia nepalensis]
MSEATVRRRVTSTDVAREAGVSRATVTYVLNDTPGQTIPQSTRTRVLEAAARLGYRPNSAARTLASGRSRIVLLVLPDWPQEFSFRHFLDEASLALDESGYSLVTYTRHPGTRGRPLWEALNPDLVIGLVPFDPDDVASIRGCGVTRLFPDPDESDSADLSMAVSAGPELQVDHLIDRGHRRLVYATFKEPPPYSLVLARHRAACDRAYTRGLPPPDLERIDHQDGSTEEAIRRWRDMGITGVIAFNDIVAAVVVVAAATAGLRVPDDIAVIGHDDNQTAAMFVPQLSTIRFDPSTLGRDFANLALHKLEGRPWQNPDASTRVTLVRRRTT